MSANTTWAEDEEEWEYEYSATETETYYLTLDLPVRDFYRGKDDIVHNTRGGYRVWFNPNFNGPEGEADGLDNRGSRKNMGSGRLDDDNDDNDDDDDDDDGTLAVGLRRQARVQQQKQAVPKEAQDSGEPSTIEPEEIQVLDLHSERPLISYRGAILGGSWAENIGTELIFAPHDTQSGLPVLRHLPEGLDLLAASSSRINFNQVELKPKQGVDSPQVQVRSKRYQENGGVYVHVHSDKFGVRRPQADFLEDLTSLKRKRGEQDEMTITPVDTPHNQLLQEDADEEVYRHKLEKDRARRLTRKEADGSEQTAQMVPRRGRGWKRWA